MTLLPLFLDLSHKRVLLVGGGSVAQAKLATLLPTGATLIAVATRFSPPFRQAAEQAGVTLQERPFHPADLEGVHLVVSATNQGRTNAFIAQQAQARGIWVNAVDDPGACDACFAATLRRGPWTLAIGTAGHFPGLSRSLRIALETLIPSSDAPLLEQLAELRARIRTHIPEPAKRTRILQNLLQTFHQTYFPHGPHV